jgi:hypothetical protein
MSLSAGHLTTKQKLIWNLKSKGLTEKKIAEKLFVTRQAVHKAISVSNAKISESLEEVAMMNKIETKVVNPSKGFLIGHSAHFNTEVFITFSAVNGLQIWYKHNCECEKCGKLKSCRETLLAEARERNFLLLDDSTTMSPSRIAEALFSKIIGESKNE